MDIAELRPKAAQVSEQLKVMAHPERLLVLCTLMGGEVGAGELQKTSELSQSAFSQHLSVLKKHNLVSVRKESQQVFYSLADEKIRQLIGCLHSIYCV
ncbi:metalloregulator ArsR/SmtB family transcription factor (plasmid) [Vibrio sp. SS-MA-C1-2]|uniref:ArsR/SmtB family transcription factor n=1 Tax=Vibrio sp. SS-MA-C1-2 TaxID=2908646 RepID=UPI001F3C59ED|nr:metalloregulator ArsR/SmtB family transcription factor [Vibrio sp. SS-MA-C1-2]UJF20250.1 metalloregulator ArsR/SmtB family transcription factor [Vibrio sp. SS-MA-C1-2]